MDTTRHLATRLEETWSIVSQLREKLDESDPDLPELDAWLDGGFQNDDQVQVTVVGTGRAFPAGLHERKGRVLKRGHTPWCWLVQLEQPIGEDQVVNLPSICLRLVDVEAPQKVAAEPRGRVSPLGE
jgi:hypothetical protein